MSKNKNGGLDQYGAEHFGTLILPESKNVDIKGLRLVRARVLCQMRTPYRP